MTNIIGSLILLITAFLTAYTLTYAVMRYALHKQLLDIPNERSSHTKITPRGGGLSVVLTFCFFGGVSFVISGSAVIDIPFVAALSLSLVIAIVGFADDHQDISARYRFAVHIFVAIIALWLIGSLPQIKIFSYSIDTLLFLFPFYTLFIVWLVNLYNFMDGIDGIASVEAVSTLLGAAAILYLGGEQHTIMIMLILAVSVFGFVLWNWPPAKVFMGDVCSGFLGYVLAIFAVMTSAGEAINIWAWLILLAVFIADATYTLFYRMAKGEKWYAPHRSHAYQILSRRFDSHAKVTIGVLFVNVVWLFPLAYLSATYESYAAVIALIAYSPLLAISAIAKKNSEHEL